MPKFLLIDGSITGPGGHHYQYALHCLRAARGAGYDTFLAAGRDCGIKGAPCPVLPAYRNGFWANDEYGKRLNAWYSWSMRTRLKVPVSLSLRALAPLAAGRLLDGERAGEFAEDTRALLSEVPLAEGDVAFVPTSGLVEVLGASEAGGGGEWNFLFRRSIHPASQYSWSLPAVKRRLLKAAFAKFKRRPGVRARFWTDSDQLTEEYRTVEEAFGTLPIPHTSPKPASPPAGTFTASYLGDARGEKGYGHLPQAVGDLWNRVAAGRLKFVIQSNYNVPGGEPGAAVARAQLEQMASPGRREVLAEPLEPDQYEAALSASSVLLLPYDAQNYYARSSGICAEALAQGIPVVAPAGTWPARQFAAQLYSYQDGLRSRASAEHAMPGGLEFSRGGSPLPAPFKLDGRGPVRAQLRLEAGGWALARLEFGEGGTAGARLRLEQRSGGGQVLAESSHVLEKMPDLPYAACLARLDEDARLLDITAEPAFCKAATVVGASVSVLDGQFPRGAVGLAYDSPGQLSECIADIADNEGHYRETARRFSDKYYAKHNARRLVEMLGP